MLLPPTGDFQRLDLYANKQWRRVQHLANVFWSRWRKEYVQQLQPRSKWIGIKPDLRVGDVVIIKDDCLPRNEWRLARVRQMYPSSDDRVRKVQLSLSDGSVMDRPIHKMVLLLKTE